VLKIALLSDVHSNLEALTQALDWIQDNNVERIMCLGDVVGYGADPNPCCDILREVCDVTLMGNHDAAVIGNMDINYYYQEAKDAIFWTRQKLTKENFEWLYSLPYTHHEPENQASYFHAAPLQPSGFYYVVQTKDALAHTPVYDQLSTWNFVGHSHLLNQFMIDETRAKDLTGHRLSAHPQRKFIVNVGSTGQPRDRDNRLCFGLFDTTNQSFEHIRLDYDIKTTASKITRAGLHEKFANRLFAGR